MPPSDRAIGIVETRGIVALTAGIEAMMKTSDVQTIAIERVSSGYLAAAIQGSLAAVRSAVEAGSVAIKQYGELRAAQVYPKPHEQSSALLNGALNQRLQQAVAALEPGGAP